MTHQDTIELNDDAELIDLGVASEQTEGSEDFTGEVGASRS